MSDYPSNETLKNMIDNADKKAEDTEKRQIERHNENTVVLKEIQSDVKDVKKQTIETNGRVNKLEWWRSGLVWFVGFLVALVGFAFPLLRIVVKSDIEKTVDKSVEESVTRALSKFNIKVEE